MNVYVQCDVNHIFRDRWAESAGKHGEPAREDQDAGYRKGRLESYAGGWSARQGPGSLVALRAALVANSDERAGRHGDAAPR